MSPLPDLPPSPESSEADREDATQPGIVRWVHDSLMGVSARAGGWFNALTGWGGQSDRTAATFYGATWTPLQWPELSAMWATEDLSAKIVDVYPREALREGFRVGGLENVDEGDLSAFLDGYAVLPNLLRALIWGRLYGQAAVWMGSLTADPSTPLVEGEQIDFLRVIDDRYLRPASMGTENLDPQGRPIRWYLSHPTMPGHRSVMIHASRLVLCHGALTDDLTYVSRGYRPISVLQRPYNALRSDGAVWKSAETLIGEASIGVMKIKNLFGLVTSGQRENLTERLRLANLGRTLNRSMVLDADKEDYTRIQTTFAGIPDLTDKAIKRVASAAEIPVTVLMGEAPAGLNATGDSDLRWFLMRIHAYRVHDIQPRLLRIVRVLMAQKQSPFKAQAAKASIMWPDLWTPSAAERADIYQKTAAADQIYIDMGALLPEEVRRSRFTDDGYSQDTTIEELYEEPATGEDEKAAGGPAVLAGVVAQAVSGAIPKSAARVIIALAVGEDVADEMLADVSDEPPEPVEPPGVGGAIPPKGPPADDGPPTDKA